jgi:hypothetical protein
MKNNQLSTNPILEYEKKKFPFLDGKKLVIGGLSIIALPFLLVGIATAYYNFTLSSLENSYRAAVESKEAAQKAECLNRKALASFKADGLKEGPENNALRKS